MTSPGFLSYVVLLCRTGQVSCYIEVGKEAKRQRDKVAAQAVNPLLPTFFVVFYVVSPFVCVFSLGHGKVPM